MTVTHLTKKPRRLSTSKNKKMMQSIESGERWSKRDRKVRKLPLNISSGIIQEEMMEEMRDRQEK